MEKAEASVKSLLNRLRMQAERLNKAPGKLEGRNQRSAVFNPVFLVFRYAGAKHWKGNLAIAMNRKHSSLQLLCHHIFPKANLPENVETAQQNPFQTQCIPMVPALPGFGGYKPCAVERRHISQRLNAFLRAS